MGQVARLVEVQVPPVDDPTRRLLEQAVAEAFVHTFRMTMLICAALALASALCAAVTPAVPRRSASNNTPLVIARESGQSSKHRSAK
jgi:hypothetical protein